MLLLPIIKLYEYRIFQQNEDKFAFTGQNGHSKTTIYIIKTFLNVQNFIPTCLIKCRCLYVDNDSCNNGLVKNH